MVAHGRCSYSCYLTLSQVSQAGGAKSGENRLVLFIKSYQGALEEELEVFRLQGIPARMRSCHDLPLREDTSKVGTIPGCPLDKP